MAFEHQDWNTVVFHKSRGPQHQNSGRDKDAIKNALRSGGKVDTIEKDRQREERDRARKLEQETAVLPRLSAPMRKLMMDARTKKNLTREQLAQMLNVKPKIIADMESGAVVTDLSLLAKVKRALAVPELRFES